MSSEALTQVSGTHRLSAVLLIVAALIAFSAFVNMDFLTPAMALVALIASTRGYTVISYLALSKCEVRTNASIAVSGKPLTYSIEVANKGLIPIALVEITLNYSQHLRLIKGSKAAVLIIPPKKSVKYEVVFEGRVGKHYVGPLKAVVRDPLGLFRSSELELVKAEEVAIQPAIREVVIRRVWIHTRSAGVVRSGEPGSGVEFYGVREFRPGDDLRRVVWRTLASSNRLSVKEMEREAYQNIVFVVDASPQMFYGPYRGTPYEHASEVIASISAYLAKRGDLMSLVVITRDGILTSGKPSRGRNAYVKILKTLSRIPYVTEPVDRGYILKKALKEVLNNLPREKNLIFVFTTAGDETYLKSLVEFINKLRSLNNDVYVALSLTVAYEVRGLPPWAQAIYRVKLYDKVREELEFARKLVKYRAKVIAIGPQYMPETIVRIVEARRS